MRSRHHSSRQSKSFAAKRRTRNFIRWGLVTVFSVLAVMLISTLSSWSALTITNVQVSGLDENESLEVHDLAMSLLNGSYLGIFARNNAYLYPRSAIRNIVKDTHVNVATVDVSRFDHHTLIISVHERNPVALICASLPDFDAEHASVADSGACYFADEKGLMYKKAPLFPGSIYRRYYIPELASNFDIASSTLVGKNATTTSEFDLINSAYDTVVQNGITVDAMLMKGNRDYELYIRNPAPASSTAVVYFDTVQPLGEQITNLITFWNHTIEAARSQKQAVDFDYIDVRYSPNIYYRFAN